MAARTLRVHQFFPIVNTWPLNIVCDVLKNVLSIYENGEEGAPGELAKVILGTTTGHIRLEYVFFHFPKQKLS